MAITSLYQFLKELHTYTLKPICNKWQISLSTFQNAHGMNLKINKYIDKTNCTEQEIALIESNQICRESIQLVINYLTPNQTIFFVGVEGDILGIEHQDQVLYRCATFSTHEFSFKHSFPNIYRAAINTKLCYRQKLGKEYVIFCILSGSVWGNQSQKKIFTTAISSTYSNVPTD